MLKKEIRVIGIDDAPFNKFRKGNVLVIGAVFRGGSWLDGILSTKVSIDGNNATRKLIEIINKCKFKPQLQCIFLDGIAVGGFNIVDIEKIYETTALPIITITRDEPDFVKIKNALKNNFTNWEKRWNILNKLALDCISL